ncbi:hypothetical protein [Paenibacillus sp. IHB B 3084]|uniref:hypothetical protein n=1 Tax=Paenibacillus sp. IHB B 3084 TaxID=867076 RepID=UPI000AF4A908|nr:hypothetical protein [Paenibacillus sp. IHB B 3084]
MENNKPAKASDLRQLAIDKILTSPFFIFEIYFGATQYSDVLHGMTVAFEFETL